MSDESISPYSPSEPSKPFRTYESDPRKHLFSKWSIVKWFTYFLISGIFVTAVTNPDYIQMYELLIFIPIIGGYYLIYLRNPKTLDKTFTRWGFKWKALKIPIVKQSEHMKIKFVMTNSEMSDLLPLEEISIVKPGEITLLKYTNKHYGVMWKTYPKKNEDDYILKLELIVKKFLDGINENLTFKQIWYTVENPKQTARNLMEIVSNEGDHSKARDIHLQGLTEFIDMETEPQSVGKYICFIDLGYCKNLTEAQIQFDAIVPGLEDILKPALNGITRVTSPEDVYGIFEEIWGITEVVE